MDGGQFDALARLAGSRRGLLGAIGVLVGSAGFDLAEAGRKRHKRRRRRQRDNDNSKKKRQYPVFTTCYTSDGGEVGEIPDGPHPTCQSSYDPDEFVPCNPEVTFAALKAKCDETYPECNGECRIKAEPIVGLGDCPDFTDCVVTNGPPQPIPGGPHASCWSWPDFKCETCPNEKPDYQGLKDLCGTAYPPGKPITCWDRLGRNDCYPIGCDGC
ncbi:MAG: hypothetical protein U0031_17165 [Thermomicrobiales bacterium]